MDGSASSTGVAHSLQNYWVAWKSCDRWVRFPCTSAIFLSEPNSTPQFCDRRRERVECQTSRLFGEPHRLASKPHSIALNRLPSIDCLNQSRIQPHGRQTNCFRRNQTDWQENWRQQDAIPIRERVIRPIDDRKICLTERLRRATIFLSDKSFCR